MNGIISEIIKISNYLKTDEPTPLVAKINFKWINAFNISEGMASKNRFLNVMFFKSIAL